MSDFDLLYFLELFTIRSKNKYDNDLIFRCRKIILSIYKDLFPSLPTNLTSAEFDYLIHCIYIRSLPLNNDEFLFIRAFIRYVKMLTLL